MLNRQVFIVDNYDSFTYNLVESLRKLGVRKIKVKKHDRVQITDVHPDDHLIFSPGPALPKDHPIMFELLEACTSTHPILGVCLGHQAIGQWCGAQLRQLDTIKHGHKVPINIHYDPDLFKGMPRDLEVGLYHSWVVENLPDHCSALANSADGHLMAMSLDDSRVVGVQFHPESYMTDHGLTLLHNFLNM
jgi:anthranilate synthase/aminodeoxychorismate synthase-like glutamine amidotransferase